MNSTITYLAGLSLAGLALSTVAAMAAPATIGHTSDLHEHPHNWSQVVDTVYQGEEVDVHQCQGSWCYVTHPGPDGWVRAYALAPDNVGPGNGSNCNFQVGPGGLTITCDGNSVTVGGNQPTPPAPPPAPPKPKLPYGPDTCKQGYVWRDAIPGDHVCVTPQRRTIAAHENAIAGSRVNPSGNYGPNSCKQGFVWREAYAGDVVCVVPARRTQVKQENIDGPSHRVLP